MRATRSVGTSTTGQASIGTESNLPPPGVCTGTLEPTQTTPGVSVSHATIEGNVQTPYAGINPPIPTGGDTMALTGKFAHTKCGLAHIPSHLEQPITHVQ